MNKMLAILLTIVALMCHAIATDLSWRLRGLQNSPEARSDHVFVSNATHAMVLGGIDKNGDELEDARIFSPCE